MDNDFLNQLNQSCKSKEEIEKERIIQQQKIDAENNAKIEQAEYEAEVEYNKLKNQFVDVLKNESVKAVSKGKYIIKNSNKLLKGFIQVSEYINIIWDCEDTSDLFLTCQFYEPIEKSKSFFGKQIIWEEDKSIIAEHGSLSLYCHMLPISSPNILPYNKCLREMCDAIQFDKDFLSLIKKSIPTIEFDKKWRNVGRNEYRCDFIFTF